MNHGQNESEGADPGILPQTVTRRSFIKRTSGTVLAFGLLGATALAAYCPPGVMESCFVAPGVPGNHLVVRNPTNAPCVVNGWGDLVAPGDVWFRECHAF